MESVLDERERTGVPDAILLEDYLSEKAFTENLKKRYHQNIIYVSTILPALQRDCLLWTYWRRTDSYKVTRLCQETHYFFSTVPQYRCRLWDQFSSVV